MALVNKIAEALARLPNINEREKLAALVFTGKFPEGVMLVVNRLVRGLVDGYKELATADLVPDLEAGADLTREEYFWSTLARVTQYPEFRTSMGAGASRRGVNERHARKPSGRTWSPCLAGPVNLSRLFARS